MSCEITKDFKVYDLNTLFLGQKWEERGMGLGSNCSSLMYLPIYYGHATHTPVTSL